MTILSKEAIEARVKKPKLWDCDLTDELGGIVQIRSLTGAEQLELERQAEDAKKKEEYFDKTIELLSKVICDENGQPLFPGEEGQKIIGNFPKAAIQKLDTVLSFANRVPKFAEFIENLKKMIGEESTSDSANLSE